MARALVVGAGITGLSAALLLARRGLAVELWEAEAEPGGLLAPVRFRGREHDRGSHRVHPEAHPLVLELTREEGWQARPRRGLLRLAGRSLPYPPDPIRFLRALGPRAAAALAAGYALRPGALRRSLRWEEERVSGADEGFERFVLSRVGGAAYRAFYRPYVEKVWGVAPDELSQSVAKRRVSTTSPLRALRGGARAGSAASFLYPRRGMAGLVRRLRDEAIALGVDLRHDKRATLDELRDAPHEHVLFSGHLGDLVPEAGLEHRGLYLLHLAVPDDAVLGDADTWYAPEARYWFGRVSRPDAFSDDYAREGERVLCVEIPEGRWGRGRDFLAHLDVLRAQLAGARVLRPGAPVLDAVQTYLPRVYPLYRVGWRAAFSRALRALVEADPRVLPIGRQGLFLHCNIDHCVHIAGDAAEHVVGGGDSSSWAKRAADYHELRVRD